MNLCLYIYPYMNIKKERLLKRISNEINRQLSDRFGISLDFTFKETGPDKFEVDYPDDEIPFTIRDYKFSDWDDNRYALGKRVVNNSIKEILDFFGFQYLRDYTFDNSSIRGQDFVYFDSRIAKDRSIWEKYSVSPEGEIKPNNYFIYLDNGDNVISKLTGFSYIVMGNNKLDWDNDTVFHLSHIENSDWWDDLTPDDKEELEYVFG